MSDGNRVSLAVVVESSYGVIPSGPAPTMQVLRKVSESLARNPTYTDSKEIRSDRQTAYSVLTDVDGGGEIPFEFSYGSYDMFWEALLQGTWAGIVTIAANTTISISSVSPYTLHRSSGSFITDGITTPAYVGKWMRVRGFTGTGSPSEFFAKIVSITASDIVFTAPTETIVTDAAGEAVTIVVGDCVENGTTQRSFFIEKQFEDMSATNSFERYTGYVVASGSLSTTVGGIITGTFGFLGKNSSIASATASAAYTAATTTSVMNAVTNVKAVLEAGAAFGVRAIDWNLNNNLRKRGQVGTLGAVSVGSGSITLKGTMSVYNSDGSAVTYAKFVNDTVSSVAIVFRDNDGNAYVIDIPNIKFTQGSRNTTGINTDVIVPLAFTATISPTELKTIRMQRWAA